MNDGWLKVCVSLMAAFATVMLGTSQNSTTLPVVAIIAAGASLLLTDYLGWVRLNRFVAGVAGVVAGINAFIQSQEGGLETQFISVANLLIHLQIILLFQRKEPRIYWQLISLSLLQVVVAAALNLFVLFGPLLVMYTGFAIAAMLLFFRHRESEPYLKSTPPTRSDPSAQICLEPSIPFAVGVSSHTPRQARQPGYARHFAMLSLSTVLASACVFLFMPRFGDGAWRAKSNKSSTGFSGEVDLEDVGSIYESPAVVMRVSFVDTSTNQPYTLSSFPYFRGTVLDDYGGGRWRRSRGERDLNRRAMDELAVPQRIYSAVQQRVHLESGDRQTVFTVAPVCGLSDSTSGSIRVNRHTLEARYFRGKGDDPTEYSVGTLGFRNGLQSEFMPKLPEYRRRPQARIERYRDDVLRRLPALSAKAAEVVAEIPEQEILRRARALESHFTDGTAGYKYSLDPSPDRNPRRDPVEDFAINHKSGHCQFFASALALMLRSQGILSRVVVGYRADNFNAVGNYYQLREMDAHAWVEAAIPADQIPDGEILPTEGLGDAAEAWVRLDPTPSGDLAIQSVKIGPWRQKIGDAIDYLQLLWSEYVLGLNEKRQRQVIYEPIRAAFKNLATLVFSQEVWNQRWKAVERRIQGDFLTRNNLQDGLIATVALTLLFYSTRFIVRSVRRFRLGKWRRSTKRIGRRIEFYRRLETLLGEHGLRRSEGQTPREFAEVASQRLQKMTADSELAAVPPRVVEYFYRVRFGNGRLDNAEVKRLETWLGSLRQSLTV